MKEFEYFKTSVRLDSSLAKLVDVDLYPVEAEDIKARKEMLGNFSAILEELPPERRLCYAISNYRELLSTGMAEDIMSSSIKTLMEDFGASDDFIKKLDSKLTVDGKDISLIDALKETSNAPEPVRIANAINYQIQSSISHEKIKDLEGGMSYSEALKYAIGSMAYEKRYQVKERSYAYMISPLVMQYSKENVSDEGMSFSLKDILSVASDNNEFRRDRESRENNNEVLRFMTGNDLIGTTSYSDAEKALARSICKDKIFEQFPELNGVDFERIDNHSIAAGNDRKIYEYLATCIGSGLLKKEYKVSAIEDYQNLELERMMESDRPELHLILAKNGHYLNELIYSKDSMVVSTCLDNTDLDMSAIDSGYIENHLANSDEGYVRIRLVNRGVFLDKLAFDSIDNISVKAILHDDYGVKEFPSKNKMEYLLDRHESSPDVSAKLKKMLLMSNSEIAEFSQQGQSQDGQQRPSSKF